jgi:hypothetical protein
MAPNTSCKLEYHTKTNVLLGVGTHASGIVAGEWALQYVSVIVALNDIGPGDGATVKSHTICLCLAFVGNSDRLLLVNTVLGSREPQV